MQARLSSASAPLLIAAGGALRPVPPASEHLTHVFLGETRIGVAQLLEALLPIGDRQTVAIRFAEARWFPSARRPRLLMLPVSEGAAAVVELADEVRARLAPLLPALADARQVAPHLTLARVRAPRRGHRGQGSRRRFQVLPLAGSIAELNEAVDGIETTVHQVDLVCSHLSQAQGAGPRYELLGGARLRD